MRQENLQHHREKMSKKTFPQRAQVLQNMWVLRQGKMRQSHEMDVVENHENEEQEDEELAETKGEANFSAQF